MGPRTTTRTYGSNRAAVRPRLRDTRAARQWNDTTPRMIELQSFTFYGTPELGTEAWCNMCTTYIGVQVQCCGGPQNCTAISVRKAPLKPWPATATTLDCIQSHSCQAAQHADSSIRQFKNAVPHNSYGGYTPLEQFFLTSDAPFLFPDSTLPIGSIGDKLFSERLTQLLNTYLLTSSAPCAVSSNFSYPGKDESHSVGHSIANSSPTSSPSYGIQSTQRHVQRSQIVLRCHVMWTVVLVIVSSLLIAVGLGTAILDSCRMGPRVLDDFTSSLRYNS